MKNTLPQIEISNGFKLKLKSKKLNSGKCQVKFFVSAHKEKDKYGYLLVDSKTTLKDVVAQISSRLSMMRHADLYHHSHLYSVGKRTKEDNYFMVFEA